MPRGGSTALVDRIETWHHRNRRWILQASWDTDGLSGWTHKTAKQSDSDLPDLRPREFPRGQSAISAAPRPRAESKRPVCRQSEDSSPVQHQSRDIDRQTVRSLLPSLQVVKLVSRLRLWPKKINVATPNNAT